MKKTRKMPLLEQVEWDFRRIEDRDLEVAAEWEYARACKPFRDFMCSWLEKAIDGHTIRKHLSSFYNDPDHDRDSFFSAVMNDMTQHKLSNPISTQFHTLRLHLFSVMLAHPRNDFPAPWTAAKPNFREKKSKHLGELIIRSFSEDRMLCEDMWRTAIISGDDLLGSKLFLLSINLNDKIEDNIARFANWLRKEAKKHPRKLGQPTQAQTYPLKCLSAYRLHEAGITYAQAQELLQLYNDGGRLVPIYSDPAGWSDALRYARKRLKKLASNSE